MSEQEEQPGARMRLYLVATSHLDTQWRWTVQDTIREFLPRTLDENFARFEKYPGYVLSFEGAFRYQLIEEYYPERFERLKEYVAAGRWFPAGSMLDAPDVNVASPESLIRHLLYGSRFFERKLGATGIDVFLPDCFGFSWSLPSIAAHCGLEGFSSSKLVRWMKTAEKPFDLGVWEGPDGARILCAIHPDGYGERLEEDPSRSQEWIDRIRRAGDVFGVYVGLRYFGIGDRGGAVDEQSIEHLMRALEDPGDLEIHHGGSDQVFRSLTTAEVERLPVHRGELLLPTHGTGCWTSQGAMKRWNRRCEQLADAAERMAALASWLGACEYPTETLRQAWSGFLWHQMHDDLTGTSIPEAYRFSWNDQILALNRFATILTDSVSAVGRGLDTSCSVVDTVPLLIFNPLSDGRQDPVEATLSYPQTPPQAIRVLDAAGDEVPSQIIGRGPDSLRIVFLASVGPIGLSVFQVAADGPGSFSALDGNLVAQPQRLENRCYRVTVSGAGDVVSIHDKRNGRELLDSPLGLELLPDRSHRWPAWEILFRDLSSPPKPFDATTTVEVEESGPVRGGLKITRTGSRSTLVQRLRLYGGQEDEAEARLEFDCELDWRTPRRILKATFPLAIGNGIVTYDLGLGAIERGNNTAEKYEVPAHQWADLGASDKSWGVSILTDSKYGWDKPEDRILRLTLMRSPRGRHKFRHQRYQDFGRHRFGYALLAHDEHWGDGKTTAQAARFNQPLLVFQTGHHPGPLGKTLTFAEVDHPGVSLRALKRAEDSSEYILRLLETRGRSAREVTVSAGTGIASALEVDGCEKPIDSATLSDGVLKTRLGPFQPRAFAVELTPPPEAGAPLATQSIDLPFNLTATSFHPASAREKPGDVDFDGRGHAIPGELLHRSLYCGEVPFQLGPIEPGAKNTVACEGQVLDLPPDFDTLYLLAATVQREPELVEIRLDEHRQPLTLDPYSGFIGQRNRWRHYRGIRLGREQDGYLRRTPVAWVGTHRHGPGPTDQPYVFCYLFRYELAIPPGSRTVELPRSKTARILAATVALLGGTRLLPASPLYD